MSDIVERLREALPALKGWMLNRAEPGEDEGTAIVGGSHDDGDFAPIATVDTGLYYQDAHALPLAEAIAAAVTAAPVLLDEIDRLRAALAAQQAGPDPLLVMALKKVRAIGCTDPHACAYHGKCVGRCVQPLLNANTALSLRATDAAPGAPQGGA